MILSSQIKLGKIYGRAIADPIVVVSHLKTSEKSQDRDCILTTERVGIHLQVQFPLISADSPRGVTIVTPAVALQR